jgi:hypothetical protein
MWRICSWPVKKGKEKNKKEKLKQLKKDREKLKIFWEKFGL